MTDKHELPAEVWKAFTDQYRRPKDEPLGWRAWIGSDVVCNVCGCVLNAWVYRCPDCGQRENNWTRSKLHSLGHRLRFLGYGIFGLLYVPLAAIAFIVVGALLILPVGLALDVTGALDSMSSVWVYLVVAMGVILELAVIVGVKLFAGQHADQIYGTLVGVGVILLVAGYLYKDATTTSTCEAATNRVEAWETVLDVPGSFSDLNTEERQQELTRIRRANPQGYGEWQSSLEDLFWACPEGE